MARVLPAVMGALIEHRRASGPSRRIYLTGDTITGPHLDEIARRHPDVDLAVVHLGGTRMLGHTVTMDADQGVDFLRRVQPRQVIPLRVVQRGRTVPVAWP